MTEGAKEDQEDDVISIHTAFAGCDVSRCAAATYQDISIHTAFAGCDAAADLAFHIRWHISIHTAFAGCDVQYLLFSD